MTEAVGAAVMILLTISFLCARDLLGAASCAFAAGLWCGSVARNFWRWLAAR